MSQDSIFMSMVVAVGAPSKSFEEVRVDDYFQSYQSSGRSPVPVPQEPTDELQRRALGLPLLFKPQTEISLAGGPTGTSTSALGPNMASSSLLSSSSSNSTTTKKEKIGDPASIPLGQEFKLYSVATEKYHNIVCMLEYEGFSPEELRYHAYFRGNIISPVPITMDLFTIPDKEPSTSITTITTSDEQFQSQCALPEYNRHSPEELRVAWMLSGREMTSTDLLGPPPPSTPPAPSLKIETAPSVGIPLPVITPAAPIAPKFNFVFK